MIREIDGVDDRVSTLRRLDRALEVSLAASVYPVSEDDESLPARLLFHQFVRRQKNGVIKLGATALMRAGIGIAGVVRIVRSFAIRRRLEQLERGFQLFARRRQVLQQFYFMIKVNEKSFVGGLHHHLIEKAAARVTLRIEDIGLTAAGVNQQAQGKREIRFLGKIPDGLRPTVFLQGEIVLRKVADDLALSRTVTGSVTTLTSTAMVVAASCACIGEPVPGRRIRAAISASATAFLIGEGLATVFLPLLSLGWSLSSRSSFTLRPPPIVNSGESTSGES
jgi:hypothetical protein